MTAKTATLPELLFVQDTLDDEIVWFKNVLNSKIPCEVTVRHGEAEALDHLMDPFRPLPAVVVLDYRLPNGRCVEFVNRLRLNEKTRRVPVVLFTGCESEGGQTAGDVDGECPFSRR
jgi:response regulator RpfG family c-di-GMP phosphodiesterase